MRNAVYNSAILQTILNSAVRGYCVGFVRARLVLFLLVIAGTHAFGADWSGPEQQLARKIVAVTGPGAVALTLENRSSLSRRDSEIVQNGLRSALGQVGLRFVKADQAAATVAISLSENVTSYVWVAEIHQSSADNAVVMVSVARAGSAGVAHDSMPMMLRKTLIWSQDEPMLDVAVLEEGATPTRIAVLNAENVSLYRLQGGKWQAEQMAGIIHARAWPRDIRGRIIPAKDHLLDIYLPGVSCRALTTGGSVSLNCREEDDPWPLVSAGANGSGAVFPSAGSESRPTANVAPTAAFFAPTRNFFTGVLSPGIGKFSAVPKFYSAAFLPRDKYALWFFAAMDGRVHMVDGMSDQTSRLDWGGDIATIRTSCGAGWQILATSAGEPSSDSVRTYEFPDRDAVAVSAPVDFSGGVAALWTEARGDTAIVIVKNQETGSYEAFRLGVACN